MTFRPYHLVLAAGCFLMAWQTYPKQGFGFLALLGLILLVAMLASPRGES